MVAVRSKSQLEKLLLAKIQNAMNQEVYLDVKSKQQMAIQYKVYDVYNPHPDRGYQRRYEDGGLISDANIVRNIEKSPKPNAVRMSVSNLTKMSNDQSQYLAPLIVYGHTKSIAMGVGDRDGFWGGGYSEYPLYWKFGNKSASYADPRDFISETRRYVDATSGHINALRQGLKRQGIKVK